MNRTTAFLFRSVAVLIAVVFGYMLGLLYLIDAFEPKESEIWLSILFFTFFGAALQAGLFALPTVLNHSRSALLACAAAMMPMASLVSLQLAAPFSKFVEGGWEGVRGYPASDWRLFGICTGVLLIYLVGFGLIVRAFRRRDVEHRGGLARS